MSTGCRPGKAASLYNKRVLPQRVQFKEMEKHFGGALYADAPACLPPLP